MTTIIVFFPPRTSFIYYFHHPDCKTLLLQFHSYLYYENKNRSYLLTLDTLNLDPTGTNNIFRFRIREKTALVSLTHKIHRPHTPVYQLKTLRTVCCFQSIIR